MFLAKTRAGRLEVDGLGVKDSVTARVSLKGGVDSNMICVKNLIDQVRLRVHSSCTDVIKMSSACLCFCVEDVSYVVSFQSADVPRFKTVEICFALSV